MAVTSPTARVALVTGASGFIGRTLCSELQQRGVTVWATARHPAQGPWDHFVAADLSRAGLPPRCTETIDTVFHFAANAHADKHGQDLEHWTVTVQGTQRVLEAAVQAGVVRFIFMSTVKASGDGDEMLVDEDFDRPPDSAYGQAKLEAERLVLRAAADSGMHAAILRPSLVYGPGWKGNLARMFRAVQARRFPPVPDTGNRRSMVHVADVVSAALLAAERPEASGRAYILCDGEAYSTRRVYEAMCQALGRPVPARQVPIGVLRGAARVGDVIGRHGRWPVPFDSSALGRLLGSAWYDSGRARRELQWTARRIFEQSLPEIVSVANHG